MDYLEVTKNESLRKYEENVYLLGTIFSKKVKRDELSDESSDSDSDSSSVDEEIINLFENNKSKDPLETKEKFNQIKSKLEAEIYSNKDETITTEPQNLFGKILMLYRSFHFDNEWLSWKWKSTQRIQSQFQARNLSFFRSCYKVKY